MSDTVFICELCREQYESKWKFFRHTKLKHGLDHKSYIDEIEGFHKCPFCEKERKWHSTYYLKTCGDPNCKIKSTEATTFEHYGVTNCSKSDEIKKQKSETTFLHYGVDIPAKSQDVLKRMQDTCLSNFGVKNPYMQEKCKSKSKTTRIENHDSYVAAIRETNMKNHGGVLFQSTPEFSKKRRKRILYNGNTYDSSWEVKFAKFCDSHVIDYEYQPDISFTYVFKDKTLSYHPDFKIGNKFFEVKGDHFFDKDKMINPFDRTQDDLYEAKHKCMIENGVIILTGAEIKNLEKILLNFNNEENYV